MNQDFVRIACRVLDEIEKLKEDHQRQNSSYVDSFRSRMERNLSNTHLFSLAVHRKWTAAAHNVQARLLQNIHDLGYELQSMKIQLEKMPPQCPSFADLLADLLELEAEYDQVQFNRQEKTLSVTTDFIELEEVALGRYEIRLHLLRIKDLYRDSPYRIIALDPHPAGTDSSVTHPHVSGQRLCEGDGYLPIRKALEQGRLCDFFNLINSILHTYSPDSPYVSLSDWTGIACYDCGYHINTQESYCCEFCGNDFCDQCSTYCQICDTMLCLGCAIECPGCQRPICKDCYSKCADCGEKLCSDCINEEGLCGPCQQEREEKKENEDNEDQQTDSTAA